MEQHLSLTTEQRKTVNLSSEIQGWGADLDPSVRPGVPRDKAPELGVEALYPSIEQQVPRVRINKSTEHMRLTPVFGTSCPPKLLSGLIRDFAYKYSEGRKVHWLLLLAADRVDVFENILLDLAKGHVPNIWKEMGLSSELKYNRKNFQRKVAIGSAGLIAAAGVYMLLKARKSKPYA